LGGRLCAALPSRARACVGVCVRVGARARASECVRGRGWKGNRPPRGEGRSLPLPRRPPPHFPSSSLSLPPSAGLRAHGACPAPRSWRSRWGACWAGDPKAPWPVAAGATVQVKSLRIKLQKLQEKAVEDDDYDKAEALRHRLEELDTEKSSLHFQLPSRQPALCSLLGHLHAQAQAAAQGRAAPPACGEDPHAPPRGEPKLLEPSAQDSLRVSVTRRDWLLQEKQQLQKEIEALQARMSMLEAKDQQLRRDMEEQELLLRWEDCDLPALVCGLSPGELREVSEALRDTLALASQIPLRAEPPETLTSLQEQIKSLNLSLKEITAKVCMSERLCSTLRKKVNDIEAQLPALLEAKMLAVSGNHFSTAKELTEEIRSVTSEREALEGLLDKLRALSSRNVQKLGGLKEEYSRLRRELDEGDTAYGK
ncbi:unnamed protein product, partial [Gulo gulo]